MGMERLCLVWVSINMSRLGASADRTQSDDIKIMSRRLNGAVRLIVFRIQIWLIFPSAASSPGTARLLSVLFN